MHIYTHIVIAGEVARELHIEDLDAYFLGAVIPDVRYLTGAARKQTHLNPNQIIEYCQRFPHLKSFLLGYLVHCETDLFDLTRVLFEHTPLRFLGKLNQIQLAGVLIEDYYLEQVNFNPPIAVDSNEVLEELGIEAVYVRQFAEGVRRFLRHPTFQSEVAALQDAKILASRRARRYLRLIHAFDRSRWLRKVLFAGVPTGQTASRLPTILLNSPVIQKFNGISSMREP